MPFMFFKPVLLLAMDSRLSSPLDRYALITDRSKDASSGYDLRYPAVWSVTNKSVSAILADMSANVQCTLNPLNGASSKTTVGMSFS